MIKNIYLVRYSGPFLELQFKDKITFEQQSERMILTAFGEEKAKK